VRNAPPAASPAPSWPNAPRRRIETTLQLAGIVESCLPRKKPGQSHPATRTFQALRIAVNDELGQLVAALSAAERALKPGGKLAVVTFHSIEDRIVKRFLAERASEGGGGSRHAPAEAARDPPSS
jgi:16S rRNA (cytosine1402-N4)-methyltransferase